MTTTADDLFKPEKLSSEQKMANTTTAFRNIVAIEAEERRVKTERLRALRLGLETN